MIIADCHIYHNRGVGVFYDGVNIHQSNITGSHISYNKGGGIKLLDAEVRNIQFTGNDIEYNYDLEADASADVWIDCGSTTIREGAITGNTARSPATPSRRSPLRAGRTCASSVCPRTARLPPGT